MKEVYDLHQHTVSTVIYFGKKEVSALIFDNWKRFYISTSIFYKDACIIYDKEKENVLSWGNSEQDDIDGIYIDDLLDGLYRTFKNNDDDLFYIKAVSDYLRLFMKTNIKEYNLGTNMNYSFIVPSEWEEEIQDLIRLVFIQAGFISKQDHPDRLLFFSDVVSVFYGLSGPMGSSYSFKVGQNIILCQVAAEDENLVSIKFDLVKIGNPLFSFQSPMLFPKVISSLKASISYCDIKYCIRTLLADKFCAPDLIEDILDDMYAEDLFDQLTYSENNEDKDDIDENRPRLNEVQVQMIKSIDPSDICKNIGKSLFDSMKDLVSSNLIKVYELLILEDQYSSDSKVNPFLLKWVKYMLRYHMRSLDCITKISEMVDNSEEIDLNKFLYGAANGVLEAIQNADMYSRPRIIESSSVSSSIFLNSSPNALLNIDISFESTVITYSRLNEHGLVEEILDHNHFTKDLCLLPLKHFYKMSNLVTLHVNELFILFVEKYVSNDDLNNFSVIDQDVASDIHDILNKDDCNEQLLLTTRKQKYVKAFMLIYLIYIKELILKRSPTCIEEENIKIGYAVSIEKIVLDNIVGDKEDFQELIFLSGLLRKDDDSRKLRVIVQGEGVLPVIQHGLNLDFPLKCYFVLAQLHEDYIQLTMNQVVTEEHNQEAIIRQDEIVPMINIYDALCLNMWNSVAHNYSVIDLCDLHCEKNGNQILELVSSQQVKTEFMKNLQSYISDHILSQHANLQSSEKQGIRLNRSCQCKIHLTVDDIIEISFKPTLQSIASIICSSLINRELFGKYLDIQYMFSSIYFNKNPHLSNIFTRILNEEIDDFNREHGIDTVCSVISEKPNQMLLPTLGKLPLLYKAFQIGTLHQVYSDHFAFTVEQDNHAAYFLYKKERSDQGISFDQTAFPLFKKGDVINNKKSKKLFYLTLQKNLERDFIWICYCRLKESNALKNDQQLLNSENIQAVGTNAIYPEKNDLILGSDIPVIVSATYLPHSSSLLFSARIFGQDNEDISVEETGESMTLCRF